MKKCLSLTVISTLLVFCFTCQLFAQQKKAETKGNVAPPKPKTSAGSAGYKKLPGGVEYKIVKAGTGQKAEIGQYIEMNIVIKVDTQIIKSSRVDNQGKPVQIPIKESTEKADFTSVFKYLTVGDSVVIKVSIDTLLAANPSSNFPPMFKKGKKITLEATVTGMMTQVQYSKVMEQKNKEMQEGMKHQGENEDKTLQEYFKKNNIDAKKTQTGLYYVISKEGEGDLIAKGQKVTVNYTGKLLDGKMFDSNTDPSKGHVKPFDFNAGMGNVIPGWDEGATLLKKGSKATLYIPSSLGYGPRGAGNDIPPNAILVFDIEILDVSQGK